MSDIDDECQSLNIDISNGPPIDIDNFKIVHYTINSILAPDRLDPRPVKRYLSNSPY